MSVAGADPGGKQDTRASSARSRWTRRVLVGVSSVLAAIVITITAVTWPRTTIYYSDSDTINQPAKSAHLREILWQPAKLLDTPMRSDGHDYEPTLSADGNTLYFVRGKAGHNADIYYCRRTPEGWTAPEPLAAVNTEYDDLGPAPTADDSALYFYSDRPGGLGGYDLWVVRRDGDGWGEAANLGSRINSPHNDYGPSVTAADDELYFASNRPQATDLDQPNPDAWPGTLREDLYQRTYDLYHARITEQGAQQAQPLTLLNTPFNEGTPEVSPVGDFLYFSSDRPAGHGGFDLYRSRRLRGNHELPQNLGDAVNSTVNELDPALSMGGYALHFSSNRTINDSVASQRQIGHTGRSQPRQRNDVQPTNQGEPPPYRIFQTTSREVFTETETVRASMDWSGIWGRVGPNLLWAILALLLLLLLMAALGTKRHRRLGLLARCLLASLAAHLLLMLLFNVWEVTAAIAREYGRHGPVRVALAAPAGSLDIVSQLGGTFVEQASPAPEALPQQRNPVADTLQMDRPAELQPHHATPTAATIQDHSTADVSVQDASTSIDAPVLPLKSPPEPSVESVELAIPLPSDQRRVDQNENRMVSQTDTSALSDTPRVSARHQPTPSPTTMANLTPQQSATTSPTPSLLTGEQSTPTRDATPPPPAETTSAYRADLASVPPAKLTLETPSDANARSSTTAEPNSRDTAPSLPSASRRAPTSVTTSATTDAASSQRARLQPVAVESVSASPSLLANRSSSRDASVAVHSELASASVALASPSVPPASLDLPSLEEQTGSAAEPAQSASLVALPQPIRSKSNFALSDLTNNLNRQSLSPTPVTRDQQLGKSLMARDDSIAGASSDLAVDAGARLAMGFQTDIALPTLNLELPSELKPPSTAYAHRSKQQRQELLEERGGSAATETAVKLALQWLAKHQSEDGRWDGDGFATRCDCDGQTDNAVDVALTGLSLLAFLAADHTHTNDGPYRDVVDRAIRWLLAQQKRNGDLRSNETMYTQGIATIALAEAYGMSGDEWLKRPVERAIRFIERSSSRSGGWRYDPGQPGDTSVLGWQVMAFKSATLAEVDVSIKAFQAARNWIERVKSRSRPGRYAYQPGKQYTSAMTAEGLFVEMLLGRSPTESALQPSVAFILNNLPDWNNEPNTYYWYYATLALSQRGGQPWQIWNDALTRELTEHQRKDTHAVGSWDPVGEWTSVGGRIYQTAICTLMLEVYYRYLPLYAEPSPEDAIGTINGQVVDAATGKPIYGATVFLDLETGDRSSALTGPQGRYRLYAPELPDFFALSASADGFIPITANVASDDIRGTTWAQDFTLSPKDENVIVVEPVPEVHHLGNDQFTGSVNSQFQKDSEGEVFTTGFEMPAGVTRSTAATAEVRMLAKGVQCPHDIVINGVTLEERVPLSPRDGSFAEIRAAFDPAILTPGSNRVTIQAVRCRGDLDDFEFVNLQIHLGLGG